MSGTVIEFLSIFLIFIGSLFCFISAIGLIRLPDVYNRAHAISKSSAIGVLFILTGTLIYFVITEGVFSIRLILGIFFVFLTSPVSAHMILRSAYRSGVKLADTSVEDALRDVLKKEGALPAQHKE